MNTIKEEAKRDLLELAEVSTDEQIERVKIEIEAKKLKKKNSKNAKTKR